MRKALSLLHKSERPREKLQEKGAQALTDLELMAILLGSGARGNSVMDVADRVLKIVDDSHVPDLDALQKIEGVGLAKATLIAASLEFARRRIRPEGVRISTPTDIIPLIHHYADRKQEHFICISVNGANEVIKTRVVSIGLVDSAMVHPREVFADPLMDRASSVIIAHNHPSGNLSPTKEDELTTERLKKAAETLGINILDHIIFNLKGHYSFLENGKL